MLKIYQNTVAKSVSFEGVGLHSGKKQKSKFVQLKQTKVLFLKGLI